MSVRIFGKKFKFCRLYDDDVFGVLTRRPKPNHKILNLIFNESLKKDFLYKSLKKSLRVVIKTFMRNFRKFWKFYRKFAFKMKHYCYQNKYLSTSFNLLVVFKAFNNLRCVNLNVFLYLLRKIKEKRVFASSVGFSNTNMVRKKYEKFSYRVDIGKPKRKRKKMTLYCLHLLVRHRLRFFSSRMTKRQLRTYVMKHRGSKFFGMFFIWLLESRLDTILYRLNLQPSAFKGRQYIKHNGVLVNGLFVNIPSFRLTFGDILSFYNKFLMFELLLFKFLKKMVFMSLPYYYEVNHRLMAMKFFMKPKYYMVFFPFKMELGRLAGSGGRF